MKRLKSTIWVVFVACSSSFGSPITWTTDAVTSDASDVLTSGIKVEAFNITTSYDNTLDRTVNGVVFEPLELAGATGYGAAFSGLTGSLNYDAMLNRANYNIPQPLSVGNGNLVAGRTYAIQVWYTDENQSRTGYYGDGLGNRVFLTSNAGGGFGEHGIGTFTADNTGSQTLAIGVGSDEMLNAYQIRDLTVVPEPATISMIGFGSLIIMWYRKKLLS